VAAGVGVTSGGVGLGRVVRVAAGLGVAVLPAWASSIAVAAGSCVAVKVGRAVPGGAGVLVGAEVGAGSEPHVTRSRLRASKIREYRACLLLVIDSLLILPILVLYLPGRCFMGRLRRLALA